MTEDNKAIFLSYASQDADAARRICDALRAAGLEVWFDQSELRGGDAWDAAIRKQVKDCALFVPLISASTNARSEGYFRREWNLAVQRMLDMADDQAFLLPVVIDDTPEPAARVPDRFRERQWTRLPHGMVRAEFVERVARLLTGQPALPVATPVPAQSSAPAAGAARARRQLLGRGAALCPRRRRPRHCRTGRRTVRRHRHRDVALLLPAGRGARSHAALRRHGRRHALRQQRARRPLPDAGQRATGR